MQGGGVVCSIFFFRRRLRNVRQLIPVLLVYPTIAVPSPKKTIVLEEHVVEMVSAGRWGN